MSVTNLARRRGQILDEIMAHHRENLPKTMAAVPFEDLRAMTAVAPRPRNFEAAVRAPGVSLVAECGKASPDKGLLIPNYDAVRLARLCEKAGARAVSVLTDGRHFQGALEHLRDVREAVRVPVLRHDFIFHPYQIYESRLAGADAVLLIATVLSDAEMRDLSALVRKLGMTAVIEVHSAEEVARALPLQPSIISINNRNWQTFEIDLDTTARLRPLIPSEIAVMSENGIASAEDMTMMRAAAVDAVLVGEALARAKDIAGKVRTLVAGQ